MEVREALADQVNAIVEAVKVSLERTPPELSADILHRGMMPPAEGRSSKASIERLKLETNLPVHVADDPLTAVVGKRGKFLKIFPSI